MHPNAMTGKAYEKALVTYARRNFPSLNAALITQPSFKDMGDIRLSTAVVQAKSSPTGTRTFAGYLSAAMRQAATHQTDIPLIPIVMVRRADAPIGDGLAVVRIHDMLHLLATIDALELPAVND